MKNHQGLVIFDLDGTLFCSDTATVPAVQQVFAQFGLPAPSKQQIISYIGPSEDEFHKWVRSLCPSHLGHAVLDAVLQRERALLSQAGYLYSGVREALTSLRATVGELAVCTYASPGYAEEVLNSHEIAPFFDLLRCRLSSRDTKIEMVREILSRLDCRPGMLIGDRTVDIEAAHENGLRAIGVLYGYGSAEELACADAVASAATQLPELVHALLMHSQPNDAVNAKDLFKVAVTR